MPPFVFFMLLLAYRSLSNKYINQTVKGGSLPLRHHLTSMKTIATNSNRFFARFVLVLIRGATTKQIAVASSMIDWLAVEGISAVHNLTAGAFPSSSLPNRSPYLFSFVAFSFFSSYSNQFLSLPFLSHRPLTQFPSIQRVWRSAVSSPAQFGAVPQPKLNWVHLKHSKNASI